jgi:hypothetical protein
MILHICDGSKGGVGKSQTAQLLINYISRNNQELIVFETDTQIPDVARCVKDSMRSICLEYADLRTDDGWQTMLELLQELALDETNINKHVIMSLPGADLDIPRYTELMQLLITELNVELWDWFVLNTQRDSVSLLNASLKEGFASIAAKKIAVKNGFFGNAESFTVFDTSKTIKQVDKTIYIEKLPALVAQRLRTETATIDEIANAAKTGEGGAKRDPLYSSNLMKFVLKSDAEFNLIFGV